MRKLFSLLLIFFCTFGFFTNELYAKRFGGGKSFGMYRSSTNYSNNRSFRSPAYENMKSTASSGAKKWLGPLAGLAIGGILASLFMGHGIGTGLLSWLAIGGIFLLLLSLFRKKANPSTDPQASSPQHMHYRTSTDTQSASSPFSTEPTPVVTPVISNTPTDFLNHSTSFDKESFLREAKVQFLRLQTAYDQKNLVDIRSFATPEVAAEITLQCQERGDAHNHTEVLDLNAELLDVTQEFQVNIASVRFYGSIREELNEPANDFNEVWHFRQEHNKWIVAGIQQN